MPRPLMRCRGYPWSVGFKTGKPREIVTVIEVRLFFVRLAPGQPGLLAAGLQHIRQLAACPCVALECRMRRRPCQGSGRCPGWAAPRRRDG